MADDQGGKTRALLDVVREIGVYPEDAYDFLQAGLQFTVERVHRNLPEGESRHISGRQLSLGLRDYAWERWGFLARMVLGKWNITSTMDFGRIVYAMIEAELFARTDEDRIEDFKNVYDFRTLETQYVSAAVAEEVACQRK